jgi:hypothetical protein
MFTTYCSREVRSLEFTSHTILADQGQTKRSNFYWKWIMIVVPGLGVTDHIFFGDGRVWKKDIAGMRTSFLPLSLREVGS